MGRDAGAGPVHGDVAGPARGPVDVVPPRVSVCLPAHQAEPHLAATIESVLDQTLTDWELIVLDNGSVDRTGEIARSYRDLRIRVTRNPRPVPLADNWNAVVGMATAPYVKLLCADDLLAPTCLARSAAELDRHPDVALVATRRDFIAPDGEVVLRGRGLVGLLGRRQAGDVVERVVRSGINPIGWPSAVLLRRRDFVAVGGFDRRWLHPIDLDLWLRLLRRGGLYGLAEPLAAYRVSPGSLTAQLRDTGAQHRAMIRAFLADSSWPVGPTDRLQGVARSYLAQARLRLLFGAVNGRWRPLRRVPSLAVGGRPVGRAERDRWLGDRPVPTPGVAGATGPIGHREQAPVDAA